MKNLLRGAVLGMLFLMIIVFALSKSGIFSDNIPSGAFIGIRKNTEENTQHTQTTTKEIEKEYNNFLLKILELRKASKSDKIKQAELVTEIDSIINSLHNKPITDQWETTTLCLASQCTDEDFFDLILAIALEGDKAGVTYGNLIVNLLTANKYWNTDNVVKFSQAITKSNKLISNLNNPEITEKWHEIVNCDGICSEKNELNFELIHLIVQ